MRVPARSRRRAGTRSIPWRLSSSRENISSSMSRMMPLSRSFSERCRRRRRSETSISRLTSAIWAITSWILATAVAKGFQRLHTGGARALKQDLAELLPECGRNLVLVTADLDQPLQVRLELVLICAGRTPVQVQLQLKDLRVGQLTVHVAVEVFFTVAAVHCCGTCLVPLARTIPESTA